MNEPINELTELNETLDLCDIWRIVNPKKNVNTLFDKNIYLELINKDEITFLSH